MLVDMCPGLFSVITINSVDPPKAGSAGAPAAVELLKVEMKKDTREAFDALKAAKVNQQRVLDTLYVID